MVRKKFLSILCSALEGTTPENLSLTAEELNDVIRLAELHKVLPLIYDSLHTLIPESAPDLRQRVRLTVSQQTLRTLAFKEMYLSLAQSGLSPTVVKGIVCRNLYPKPDLRISADEDLLIASSEYGAYRQKLISLGFVVKSEGGYQTTFTKADGFCIELHTSLFDSDTDYFSKWNALFEKSASDRTQDVIEDIRVFTLSPTDNLLYLILHALKHFIHSGVGIRQICDISLFISKNLSCIDFEYIFSKCKDLGVLKFTLGILAVCKKHLTLKKEFESIPLPAPLPDEEALLEDIVNAGIYGSSTMSRRHSGSITFSSVKKGKKQNLLKRVMPSARSLDSRYSYAKRSPLLLPVAWGHRLFDYSKEMNKSENNSPKEAVKIGNRRIELLREYGLVSD